MLEPGNNDELPPIPGKRYFTIGEVSDLCAVKPHVLRYWEQEFPQLKPVKRRGNRRYYQRQDVLIIRQIRSLLYDDGFTIGGARQRLTGDQAKEDVSQSQQIIKQTLEFVGCETVTVCDENDWSSQFSSVSAQVILLGPSVSEHGKLAYLRRGTGGTGGELVWVDRSGQVQGTIGQPQSMRQPELSPDGKWVAVSAIEEGNRDIWLHDVERGSKRRFSFLEGGV